MFDRQTKKFCSAVVDALPELSEDVMQGWIGNPAGLQKVLCDVLCPPALDTSHNPGSYFQNRNGLWVSDDFRSRVVAKAKPSVMVPASKHVLLPRDMSDAEIEEMLGDGHLFTETEVLVLIRDLISNQEGGKAGKLLNNGHANLFYTSSCVVRVHWFAGRREWFVIAWPRVGSGWLGGGRVFSPAN